MINLKDIISITGKSGLYKVIAQAKNGAIVESLETKKRFPIHSSDAISALENISIYTTEEEKTIKEIYSEIYTKENGGPAPDHTSDIHILESYLSEVLPNYDRERVYASNIKKLFLWYNLLQKSGNLTWEEAIEEETSEDKNPSSDASKRVVENKFTGKNIQQKNTIKKNQAVKTQTSMPRKSGGA